MALLFKFELAIMSAEEYDQLVVMLEETGAGSPPGCFYHVAYGPKERLKVVDVWDSPPDRGPGQFQEFAEMLVPTLKELGVVLLEPDVCQVHSISKPQRTATGGRGAPWSSLIRPGKAKKHSVPSSTNLSVSVSISGSPRLHGRSQ
ncbi:hypothetical protein ABZV93_22415 [Actinopolymorpha sp. NPDC004070]|uniref:hypothetical protein n=1 Tax=Actinopolymorpha sp. NPDC004070 TaxID=3154548 RepID=UPI0033BA1385